MDYTDLPRLGLRLIVDDVCLVEFFGGPPLGLSFAVVGEKYVLIVVSRFSCLTVVLVLGDFLLDGGVFVTPMTTMLSEELDAESSSEESAADTSSDSLNSRSFSAESRFACCRWRRRRSAFC